MSEAADYKLVRNSTVGTELTEEKAKLLAEKMGVRHLKDGEVLVNGGAADRTLFILIKGRLDFFSQDGEKKPDYSMKEGECGGTRAFVEKTPRRGMLRAVGDATVYTLTPEDFESLLDAYPRVAFRVMQALFRVTHANLSRVNRVSEELSNYINKTKGRY